MIADIVLTGRDVVDETRDTLTEKRGILVQPVPELSELTQHCGLVEPDVELNGDNVQSGALHRSGSRLFKNTMKLLDSSLTTLAANLALLGQLLDTSAIELLHESALVVILVEEP
uniref:Uncharacterized protein n=1 Tax=Timema shepardi TaxID=629360 RepID=A0A7R9B614_TIMSH|nr:unnamed protein product [Timema shepardi]